MFEKVEKPVSLKKRLTRGTKKIHNFFGERPPDELIADRLEQFFPGLAHLDDSTKSSPTRPASLLPEDNRPDSTTLKNIVQNAALNKRMTRISILPATRIANRHRSVASPIILQITPQSDRKSHILSHLSSPQEEDDEAMSMQSPFVDTFMSEWNSVDSTATPIVPTTHIQDPPIQLFETLVPMKRIPTMKKEMDRPVIRSWTQGQLIGQGAFGKVFHGLNLDSGEIMAVKQVLIGPANDVQKKKREDALRREMELLEEMDNTYIVRYLGIIKGGFFLMEGYEITETAFNVFLEYVSGGSIASMLSKYGKFEEGLAKSMTAQILLGLDYLHEM